MEVMFTMRPQRRRCMPGMHRPYQQDGREHVGLRRGDPGIVIPAGQLAGWRTGRTVRAAVGASGGRARHAGQHQGVAAVVRPDHYVLGVARHARQLARLVPAAAALACYDPRPGRPSPRSLHGHEGRGAAHSWPRICIDHGMLPFLARDVVYRLQEAAMRRPTFSYLAELERSQWLSRSDMEQLQLRRLDRLLGCALTHSPWHAERLRSVGLDRCLGGGVTWDDFRRLPFMDKADAARHGERMVWHGVPGGAHRYTTGGSSGQPLIFFYGRTRQASDAATRMRARRWWGVEFGEPEVFLWGSPVELSRSDRIKTLRDRLINQLVLNAFDMSSARMDQYLDAIETFDPVCMYGYASSLALLASHAEARGRRIGRRRLKVICTTGEPLFPHQRELIARVSGVPVANEFGSRDSGCMALEAPNGQLLWNSESALVEAIGEDGQPVATGELGEAVITGFWSEAQPFIRYRTGDMVRLSAEDAWQRRGLHVLAEVAGRTTDFIVRPDGAIMHALSIIYVFRAMPGVGEFKFIQHDLRRCEALIVPGHGWSEELPAQARAGVQARLGAEVKVEIKVVDHIPPERSGKHRYVVSHVKRTEEMRAASASSQPEVAQHPVTP